MSEADILALTYEDTVTAYRALKEALPNGESVFRAGTEGRVVCREEACALSTHTGGKLRQSPSTAETETEFRLFTRPETDIQPNDFLVIRHLGREVRAVAGLPDRQQSHNNIPVRLEKALV